MPAARSKGSRSLSSRWESRETPRPMPAQQEGEAEGRGGGARGGRGSPRRRRDARSLLWQSGIPRAAITSGWRER